jgi:hypothetical protein
MEIDYSKYQISAEKTGSEVVPMMIKVPKKFFEDNPEALEPYSSNHNRPHPVTGISFWLDWEAFVTEILLPHSKPEVSGYLVDEVKSITLEGDNVCLDCLLSDPDWNH